MFLKDFKAPSLDQDEGPSNGKGENPKRDDYDNDIEDDNDKSYPLLKETDFGGTAVARKL